MTSPEEIKKALLAIGYKEGMTFKEIKGLISKHYNECNGCDLALFEIQLGLEKFGSTPELIKSAT